MSAVPPKKTDHDFKQWDPKQQGGYFYGLALLLGLLPFPRIQDAHTPVPVPSVNAVAGGAEKDTMRAGGFPLTIPNIRKRDEK